MASKAARFFGPNEEEHERFLAPRRVFALPAERVVLRARFQRPA